MECPPLPARQELDPPCGAFHLYPLTIYIIPSPPDFTFWLIRLQCLCQCPFKSVYWGIGLFMYFALNSRNSLSCLLNFIDLKMRGGSEQNILIFARLRKRSAAGEQMMVDGFRFRQQKAKPEISILKPEERKRKTVSRQGFLIKPVIIVFTSFFSSKG